MTFTCNRVLIAVLMVLFPPTSLILCYRFSLCDFSSFINNYLTTAPKPNMPLLECNHSNLLLASGTVITVYPCGRWFSNLNTAEVFTGLRVIDSCYTLACSVTLYGVSGRCEATSSANTQSRKAAKMKLHQEVSKRSWSHRARHTPSFDPPWYINL